MMAIEKVKNIKIKLADPLIFGHTSEIRKTFPNKDSARTYETNLIERYRGMYGQDTLPGNKTNR